MKKLLVATGGVALMGASIMAFGGVGDTIPPAGIIVDMPRSDVGNLRARLDLINAGGAYERDIYVVITDRTHEDNRAVLNSYPRVMQILNTSNATTRSRNESNLKRIIPGTEDIFIDITSI